MKDIKKILGLNIYFQLKDDFNGSVADALRDLADFFEAETNTLESKGEKLELSNAQEIWDKFMLTDKRFIGDVTLSELRDDNWIPLDKKIKS